MGVVTYFSLLEGRAPPLDKWFQTLQRKASLQFQVFRVHEEKGDMKTALLWVQ
jgi:hypothetical protein